ncbi:hypothetical protein [Methylobacterium sp. ID0610]|uniref:hypothetical protein n=1 Tax=Methylobacterium carpenticola TaxID=3344827 RepID=UPI0036AA1104
MADELKDQRIPIMMTPSEVKAVEDWMFANRIKSRAEAIRRLCQLGIALDSNMDQLIENHKKAVLTLHEHVSELDEEKMADLPYIQRIRILKPLALALFDLVMDNEEIMRLLFTASFVYRNPEDLPTEDGLSIENIRSGLAKIDARKSADKKDRPQPDDDSSE